ncbi:MULTISPECIES: ABC transporter substrate-binding protein [Gordonia]|nr:ABC transporter substrate-binding protein [Gordonia sp. UBA7599]GAB05249.1 putative ABC transporter substrate binding protein [Gordonia amarae NBRC 15530]
MGTRTRFGRGGMFAVALSVASALVLSACSDDGDSADDSAGKNLDGRGAISFAMGKNDLDLIRPVVASWNKAHADEQVKLVELPGEADDQRSRLVQSLQAKNSEFDVMALDVTWTAEFAANGWLEPLTGDLAIDTAGLLPATVESATYRDVLYAGPQNTNAQLLYYRKDIVGNKAPENWAALTESCAKAKAKKVDCLVTQLKQYEGLTVNASQFIHSWGGQVVGSDGKTPEVNSTKAKEGLSALVDAYKKGLIPKKATGFTEEETNLSFVGGESAYAYNWPYMYTNAGDAESKVKGKFGVAAIVGPDGAGASTLGGYNDGINVYSKHKATALDFIKYIQSAENQKSFAKASFPPVLASIYDDKGLVKEFPYLPALKDALENAKPRPVTPYYNGVSKAIQDNTYAALNGSKTVDQAAADIDAAIKVATK